VSAKHLSIREAAHVKGLSYSSMRARLREASVNCPELLDLGNPAGSVNAELFRELFLNQPEELSDTVVTRAEYQDLLNEIADLKKSMARVKRVVAEHIAPLG
jgi:hypothetical protein